MTAKAIELLRKAAAASALFTDAWNAYEQEISKGESTPKKRIRKNEKAVRLAKIEADIRNKMRRSA